LPFERQPRPGQPRNAPSHPRPPTSRPGAVPERQPRPGQPRNAPIHPRSPRAALGRSRASAQTRPTTERPEPPTILTSRPGPFAVRRSSEPLPRDALSPPESRPRLPLVEAAKRPRCGATEQPSVSPDQANHGTPRTDPRSSRAALVRRSPFAKRAASAGRAQPSRISPKAPARGSGEAPGCGATARLPCRSRTSIPTRPDHGTRRAIHEPKSRPGAVAVPASRFRETRSAPPESRPRLPLVEAAKRPGVERPVCSRWSRESGPCAGVSGACSTPMPRGRARSAFHAVEPRRITPRGGDSSRLTSSGSRVNVGEPSPPPLAPLADRDLFSHHRDASPGRR
jgi:hypothetical protein